MPANLNALIRYKTINSCLHGGRRKWSIDELMEKCSEALAEYRGRTSLVSERTTRDDIRVMRSEILGFNAPIQQEGGLYFYSDPNYSIMTISLTDSGVILEILAALRNIRLELDHPELEKIIQMLGRFVPFERFDEEPETESHLIKPRKDGFLKEVQPEPSTQKWKKPAYKKAEKFHAAPKDQLIEFVSAPAEPPLTWDSVFRIAFSGK